jgi:hypothetical protein
MRYAVLWAVVSKFMRRGELFCDLRAEWCHDGHPPIRSELRIRGTQQPVRMSRIYPYLLACVEIHAATASVVWGIESSASSASSLVSVGEGLSEISPGGRLVLEMSVLVASFVFDFSRIFPMLCERENRRFRRGCWGCGSQTWEEPLEVFSTVDRFCVVAV